MVLDHVLSCLIKAINFHHVHHLPSFSMIEKHHVMSWLCLQSGKMLRIILFASGGGLRLAQPPLLFLLRPSKLAVTKEGYAHHFVCKWWATPPPNTSAFLLRPSMFAIVHRFTSFHDFYDFSSCFIIFDHLFIFHDLPSLGWSEWRPSTQRWKESFFLAMSWGLVLNPKPKTSGDQARPK